MDVNATGNVTNNAWAGSATFGDGTGSFGFTMGTDKTNVLSQVDGHITAGGIANVLEVNLSKVNQTNDTITIPNHGLTTGQAIVYHAAAPPSPSDPLGTPTPLAPIGGLTDGQTYYVIVKDPNTIQLASRTQHRPRLPPGSIPVSPTPSPQGQSKPRTPVRST